MNWKLSFKLQPGEQVVEQQPDETKFGMRSVHSAILTNRRAIFKFNTLSSGLVQSFPYEEISCAMPVNRLLIKYLKLTAKNRDYFLNVSEPEDISRKILANKEKYGGPPGDESPARPPSMSDLLSMLDTLKQYGLLSEEEHLEKCEKILK